MTDRPHTIWIYHLAAALLATAITIGTCALARALHAPSLLVGGLIAGGYLLAGLVATCRATHGSVGNRLFWGLGLRIIRTLVALSAMVVLLALDAVEPLPFLLATLTGTYAATIADSLATWRLPTHAINPLS